MYEQPAAIDLSQGDIIDDDVFEASWCNNNWLTYLSHKNLHFYGLLD